MKLGARLLSCWLLLGEWRAYPLRALVAIAAIALGVGLGFAIYLINAAALDEFSAAVKSLSGQSDFEVRSAQSSFDQRFYPWLAQHDGVAVASPILELDAAVPGQKQPLKILGIDVFRAAAIAPDFIGIPAEGKVFDTLADDAIFLSPAAMAWLRVRQGDVLRLRSGTRLIALRVAGGLVHARAGQRIAVMDIAAAQWRFHRLGQVSRVELKLTEGINRAKFKAALQQQLQGKLLVTQPRQQTERAADMSRAYRVNLNVLAMVALFTGAFLVFSTQALSVMRRRSQFALLRVMGMSRHQLLRQVLLEGSVIGVLGSALGVIGGYVVATIAMHFFGGDLGGGYFTGINPQVHFSPMVAVGLFLLGVAVAVLGALTPAWEAARSQPASALKSGSDEVALSQLGNPLPALIALGVGVLLTQLPAVGELPVFGYVAVVLLLIGTIALMPHMTGRVFGMLSHWPLKGVIQTLALARLSNAPNQAAIALGGVLTSFSLMVAMAIMVASFRVSVDDWLLQVLSADVYVRTAQSGDTATLDTQAQMTIAHAPGIARADFLRESQLTLDPVRPNVALIARAIDVSDPGKILPIMGPTLIPQHGLPIWVSEPMVDLYGYTLGKHVVLPLNGRLQEAVVAGIWRDYGRQFGAIQMRLADYRTLTGDMDINAAGLWLEPGVSAARVIATLKHLPFGAGLEVAEPSEIRALSLKIFDRSFAVTYLLEVVAIIIGLFGVAATFSAQTLARAKEFGMLRHLGVSRRQILGILATEGGMLTAMGIGVGFVLGWVISLILVFVVNPQSFHWSMQMHLPWGLLASVAALLLVSAMVTALVAGRYALSGSAIRAVSEDW